MLNNGSSCTCLQTLGLIHRIARYSTMTPLYSLKNSLHDLTQIEFVVTKGSTEQEILLSQVSTEPRTSLEVIKTKLHKFGIN